MSEFWCCNAHPVPKTECNRIEQMKKRGAEANSANAHYAISHQDALGCIGLLSDGNKMFEFWTLAS